MIRPVLTELVLFVLPFALYVVYLLATKAELLHPESWPMPTLVWLSDRPKVCPVNSPKARPAVPYKRMSLKR